MQALQDACDRGGRRWIERAIAAAIKNAWAIHAGMRDELPAATTEQGGRRLPGGA